MTSRPMTRLARITDFDFDRLPQDEGLDCTKAIGRDHRHAGERQFQRHCAGLGERAMRDAKGGALLRFADHDARVTGQFFSPSVPRSQDAAWSEAPARSSPLAPAAAQRPPKTDEPDLAAAAARQHQQHRRLASRCAARPGRPQRSSRSISGWPT